MAEPADRPAAFTTYVTGWASRVGIRENPAPQESPNYCFVAIPMVLAQNLDDTSVRSTPDLPRRARDLRSIPRPIMPSRHDDHIHPARHSRMSAVDSFAPTSAARVDHGAPIRASR